MPYDFSAVEKKLKDAREWLAKEYRSLRTVRASPVVLDGVTVSGYRPHFPL